mgnify:CR=1 FL=1
MEHPFLRNEMLWGPEAQARLARAHVLLLGLGGVGSYAAECLARSGVGELTLVDSDTIALTNLNRQLEALHSTLGQPKAEAVAARLRDINPDAELHPVHGLYDAAHRDRFFPEGCRYDYIVDAIDLVSCKLDLAETALKLNIPLIAALGTGNKLDATLLQVTDISKTYGCPLARVMRKELRTRGIHHLKVVFSPEQPAATATVPAHKEDTSLSAPKMEPDSGRPSATKETVGKDIIAKTRQDSPSQSTPSRATSATVPKATASKATAPKATPAGTPIMEEIVAPAEELEEAAITTVTDTSFLDANRKKMKVAQLATQMNNMIKGKVTDDKGEPLIGANVTYKGTTYGTITDINGEFSLPKKEGNAILTAHYIGYNPVSIPADTSKTMLIAMHENKTTLNEVVVTGYGTQKKVAVTGAISAVSIKDLKKASGALQKSDTLKDAATLQWAVIPEPVTGMKQYKKYLKKNLAYPADDTCAEVKGKVTLTFFVNKEGRPFDIKVKESLCKSLDKEAIRLIQEGPDWTYGNQSAEITVKVHK